VIGKKTALAIRRSRVHLRKSAAKGFSRSDHQITRSPDLLLVPVPVMMVAVLARLLQLMTSSFRLGAMLAVPADSLLQVLFGFVNPTLAFTFVVAVVRPGRNCTGNKAEGNERGNPQFGSKQDLLHGVSLFLIGGAVAKWGLCSRILGAAFWILLTLVDSWVWTQAKS
jgi:hypothetical protein